MKSTTMSSSVSRICWTLVAIHFFMMSICTLVVSTFSSNSGGNLVLFRSFMSAPDSCMAAEGSTAGGARRGGRLGRAGARARVRV